jgi:orotidine-5'-phosphate decarboxylase
VKAPQNIEAPAPVGLPVQSRGRLIVALDFPSANEALHLVDQLEGACQWFKVGLELYLSAGNQIVAALKERGFSVFLDLKLHDIPNTVAGAVRSVVPLGADLLTLHALGGPEMLKAAAEAAGSVPNAPRLLAVTVLTSMDTSQLAAIGVSFTPAEWALGLASMAHRCGIGGFVCSPEEAASMRSKLPDVVLVTPGIRPSGAGLGDQKRVATPAAAIAAGANYLVVGRPITQAHNPGEAARHILDEIDSAAS